MRYFGSKFSTLEQLGQLIAARKKGGTFCDAFGGIGTVGSYFKALGYRVWTSDVLHFAHCFQIARIKRTRMAAFRRVRREYRIDSKSDLLSALRGPWIRAGWFVDQYAIKRKFFTHENAIEIERVWRTILRWQRQDLLTHDEYSLLIASLIHSMDQVANTAGTYYAYLGDWDRKALKPFRMKLMDPVRGAFSGTCHLGTALELVESRHFDVLYLDPPYNERSYPHYYHLPETIALGRKPIVHGSSGVPVSGIQRSDFNDAKQARKALESLLKVARWRLLAFHYADNGLISRKDLRQLLSNYGRMEEVVVTAKGYTTQSSKRTARHRLYLVDCA